MTDAELMECWPITRWGGRWVCDGPLGRFHSPTKREALAVLRDDAGRSAFLPCVPGHAEKANP